MRNSKQNLSNADEIMRCSVWLFDGRSCTALIFRERVLSNVLYTLNTSDWRATVAFQVQCQ